MEQPGKLTGKENKFFAAAIVIMIVLSFWQCYRVTHDLNWYCEVDFDRDMAFVQGALDGHPEKDPNYKGEYIWYNPLLFSLEALVTKITGMPPYLVLARLGIYFNLLGPLFFILMTVRFFDFKIAAASLMYFLFFSAGNMLAWGAATYSPWAYPVNFMQFIFYLNLLLCYNAFSTEKYSRFFLLGAMLGISFLGHMAPTLLIILIMILIQSGKIINAIKGKNTKRARQYFYQGVVTFIPMIMVCSPFLFFVAGIYQFKIANRTAFEATPFIMRWYNFPDLLREIISVSFFISVIGFFWFFKNFHHSLIRKLILYWFYTSAILYVYSSLIGVMSNAFQINLPGTVPVFHFFFYLKGVQAVFYGFGFVFIAEKIISLFIRPDASKPFRDFLKKYSGIILLLLIMVCILLYFPYYQKRHDFVHQRNEAKIREGEKDKIETYKYIVKHIPGDKVILCEKDATIFPVMPTARKMVSINLTLSNIYVDFKKRDEDREAMLNYLKTGMPAAAEALFDEYEVSYVLLENGDFENYITLPSMFDKIIFKNSTYTLFQKS